MARNVLFWHLTRPQAAALLKIDRGERFGNFEGTRGRPFIVRALRERGLLEHWTLTPLGRSAAQLVRAVLVSRGELPGAQLEAREALEALEPPQDEKKSVDLAPAAAPRKAGKK